MHMPWVFAKSAISAYVLYICFLVQLNTIISSVGSQHSQLSDSSVDNTADKVMKWLSSNNSEKFSGSEYKLNLASRPHDILLKLWKVILSYLI